LKIPSQPIKQSQTKWVNIANYTKELKIKYFMTTNNRQHGNAKR
jgi:hypothetical protein